MPVRPLAIALALTIGSAVNAASPVSFDNSWKTQRFSLFSANSYGFRGNTLTVASMGAVSLAYTALSESLWPSKSASWNWRVIKGVPATDLRNKGGDDRNLAMYLPLLLTAH